LELLVMVFVEVFVVEAARRTSRRRKEEEEAAAAVQVIYFHMDERLLTAFGLEFGFMEHLQIVTTSKYSAISNLCTRVLTTTRTKSSSPVVAW
jgi:hypothetical protein